MSQKVRCPNIAILSVGEECGGIQRGDEGRSLFWDAEPQHPVQQVTDRHMWYTRAASARVPLHGGCCRGKGGMRGARVGNSSGTELAVCALWAGLEQLETGSFHWSALYQCSYPLPTTGCGMSSCSHPVITLCQWREDAFKSFTSVLALPTTRAGLSEGCRMKKHPARLSNCFWPLTDCNSPWILRLFPANWNDCGRTDFAATQTSLLSQRKSIPYSFLQQVRWHQLCGWTNVLKTCQNS